jgi:serine/threonine protein kinase
LRFSLAELILIKSGDFYQLHSSPGTGSRFDMEAGMNDWVGQTVGRYYLIEALGEGGMATVYRAYDTRLRREVAVKFIRQDLIGKPGSDSEPLLKRFEREAVALGKLSHPNIVGVHDYGEHQGIPYLVMEFVEGGTLKQLLGRPIACDDAARLLAPIARALDYAHQHKLVHRDVKPSNILLSELGVPKLSDFGIARLLESGETTLTTPGVGIGTPEYMAPEQSLTGKVDARADIYSLGVVFYEMLTGQKPYRAETPMAVMLKHLHDPLPRPSSIVTGIPEEVERIVFRSMAKQPEDRYQSMAEFAHDLEKAALGFGPVPAADSPTLHQQPSPQSAPAAQPRSSQPLVSAPATPLRQATATPLENDPSQSAVPSKKRPAWMAPALITGGLLLIACLAVVVVMFSSSTNRAMLLGLIRSETPTSAPTHTPRPTRTPTLAPTATLIPTAAQVIPTQAPPATFAPEATQAPAYVSISEVEYVVQQGDTCQNIALAYDVSVESIVQYNGMASGCNLYEGQSLLIQLPTSVPSNSQGWRQTFVDDFSNSNSGWENFDEANGKHVYYNGSYLIQDMSGSIWGFAPGIYSDVRVEVDWNQIDGTDPSTGIFCRYNGDIGVNAYMAVIYSDGTYSIQKFVDTANFVLKDWSTADNLRSSGVNRLRLDCFGNLITLYVNGVQIAQATDGDLTSGFTGMGLFRNSGESALATFDNYALYIP